jgi:hypothetical protein
MDESRKTDRGLSTITGDAERSPEMREQLEEMFRNLYLAHEEISVCGDAAREEGHPQLARVLHLSVSNRLFNELKALTTLVERLGGRTGLSDTDI